MRRRQLRDDDERDRTDFARRVQVGAPVRLDAEDLQRRWLKVHLSPCVNDYRDRGERVYKRAQIHLPERNHKARVHRHQEQKIQFAGANQFRQVRAVNEKESLEHLLNEMTRSDQSHHLPFCPGADVVGVQV